MPAFPLIAVDIGNARAKLGFFSSACDAVLPEPEQTLTLAGDRPQFERLAAWRKELNVPVAAWHVASVNRPATTRLLDWLGSHYPGDPVVLLSAADLPLAVKLERPDMVGVDRLLDAVAANRLRTPGVAAVVVDVGTAITVDLVSPEGEFLGGSILPGIAMSARALHEFTDLLPLLDMSELAAPPPALGVSTITALRSGLFWGAVGAVRQLVGQLAGGREVEVMLTGGAGPAVAALLGPRARHVPHLTLSGIALTACSLGDKGPHV
jgi:type III pantothenate kinase